MHRATSFFFPSTFAGKLNRGLSVIDSYNLLREGKELTQDEVFEASVLGWCIEWVSWHLIFFLPSIYLFIFTSCFSNIHSWLGKSFSSRHIFWFLTILWTALKPDVVNFVGLDWNRLALILLIFILFTWVFFRWI